MLIKGDSGVGKTTLADRFTTALSLEGASTARMRCFGLESSIPYATIGALLEALLDRPGAAATGPESLAELAKILPEVRRRFPALPVATDSVGEQARIRFADAAHEFLCAVAEEHPVMLVVDDFDRSDEVSLGILHMLVRRLGHAPIMLVLTTRTGAQAERYEFRRLRTGIEDLGIEVLDVEPLDPEESEICSKRWSTSWASAQHERTQGVASGVQGAFPWPLSSRSETGRSTAVDRSPSRFRQ